MELDQVTLYIVYAFAGGAGIMLAEAAYMLLSSDVEQRKAVKAGTLTDADLERFNQEWQDKQLAWYADTWLNIGQDEARQIRDALLEKNPPAWEWLTDQTVQAIREYKDRKTKN